MFDSNEEGRPRAKTRLRIYELIVEAQRRSEHVTIRTLAEQIGCAHSNIARHVERLRKAGLVREDCLLPVIPSTYSAREALERVDAIVGLFGEPIEKLEPAYRSLYQLRDWLAEQLRAVQRASVVTYGRPLKTPRIA
jgi:DNA-binding transcriptional ArsR family regulator